MASISEKAASGQYFVSGPLQIPKITQKFKIGICQPKVTTEKSANIINARGLIQAAAEQGASLIFLPIHLFDMGKPLPGEVQFKESDNISAGENPTVVDTGRPTVSCLK
ncbi:hypothetical protein RND71_005968 [Anisodus tanguticus]|uniref:CN hydrolase domain-containing protein n=1 Tax=Anisodus tanguticus TaxID=243964 RepID=A0AAE1SV84_9SOLA|nr:hypothetical protein RND71_005968 [Anisodus tanguticus]